MVKITQEKIKEFVYHLHMQEKSRATINKYLHDVSVLQKYVGEDEVDKEKLISFKEHLLQAGYAVSSINSMLAAVNQFLEFMKLDEWKLKFLKIQRTTFISEKKVLEKTEYQKMAEKAIQLGDERLALLLQTICSTGIRVSELQSVTVEALREGQARIHLKGKIRQILLPKDLCKKLLDYCAQRKIEKGSVFVTRTGKPMDRSNIWKMMKRLAKQTKIKAQKVFPHNLRHLFATVYYKKFKDMVRLADILGHSSINTTRIYTMNDGSEQKREINSLSLLC